MRVERESILWSQKQLYFFGTKYPLVSARQVVGWLVDYLVWHMNRPTATKNTIIFLPVINYTHEHGILDRSVPEGYTWFTNTHIARFRHSTNTLWEMAVVYGTLLIPNKNGKSQIEYPIEKKSVLIGRYGRCRWSGRWSRVLELTLYIGCLQG